MKKNLIFQINVPNYSQKIKPSTYTYVQDMYRISERNARRYAKKFGADYYLLSSANDFLPAADKHLDYQKLKFYDFLDYDRIVYMDSDYIIKDNAPNLFEICGDNFTVCSDIGKEVPVLAENLDIDPNYYFNAGFIYITKQVLEKT
jgi:lipopolysaccharide biosynthesis glycosyltransferase